MTQVQTYGEAPEFPGEMEWFNIEKPLSIKDLKGKVVLLDFWTYCCINCMHIIPDLKKLEEKYSEELVVIGVHSAKFLGEKVGDNIREAILRYGILHPVVNDKDFQIWSSYSVRAWPTVVLIDPEGQLVGQISGEGIYLPIDEYIGRLIKQHEKVLNRKEIPLSLERNKLPESILQFPGKITIDKNSKTLYISDTNHHRIVISDLEGNIQEFIGSGKPGQQNGNYVEAEFLNPQGIVVKDNNLYVADTENHLIRKVDLNSKRVSTIAGIGEQGFERQPQGNPTNIALNSPWDLEIVGDILYIAMAGQHQLWKMDLKSNTIDFYAGNSRENIVDDKLLNAQLAQPSGLATDGKVIFFADSEVSAIRSADIDPYGSVKTIVGQGLFEFGDVDGKTFIARLQHPLGLDYLEGKLYIADTYNNKIKAINLNDKECITYAGTGKSGMDDGSLKESSFNEPNDVVAYEGKLYVCDTNNHLIRLIDMNRETVETLKLKSKGLSTDNFPELPIETLGDDVIEVKASLKSLREIKFQLVFSAGLEMNFDAPSELILYDQNGKALANSVITDNRTTLTFEPFASLESHYLQTIIYYCTTKNLKLCLLREVIYKVSNDDKGSEDTLIVETKIEF